MELINLNEVLNRNKLVDDIKLFFKNFEENKKDLTTKRGIYIYGNPGRKGINRFELRYN